MLKVDILSQETYHVGDDGNAHIAATIQAFIQGVALSDKPFEVKEGNDVIFDGDTDSQGKAKIELIIDIKQGRRRVTLSSEGLTRDRTFTVDPTSDEVKKVKQITQIKDEFKRLRHNPDPDDIVIFQQMYGDSYPALLNELNKSLKEMQKKEKPAKGKARRQEIIVQLRESFVYIEPCTFMMGSPEEETGREDNETQHEVTLTQGYYMQTTPVTQGQWKAVMGRNPSRFKKCGDDCPVENVTWHMAQEFISELNIVLGTTGYALPTEAQWEYAARGGRTTAYFFGDKPSDLSRYAWFSDNSGSRTNPAGQKPSNAWGLYDLHGNVWEWVADWYGYYPSSAVDPTGPSSGTYRVLRGGSWRDLARKCRSAAREIQAPAYRNYNYGFRLVLLPGH